MNGERTIKCPICGEPYKIYPDCVGDQSACPKCVKKAEENTKPYWEGKQILHD